MSVLFLCGRETQQLFWDSFEITTDDTQYETVAGQSLKSLRVEEQQEQEISEGNNRTMELTEQSHILSSVVAKGYIDSAVFIERQNTLTLELAAAKKKISQLLDSNGFDREIARTELLIVLIQSKVLIYISLEV